MNMYNEAMYINNLKKTSKYSYMNTRKCVFMRILSVFLCLLISLSLFSGISLPVLADEPKTDDEYQAEAEERKELTVETNEVPGWPNGPAIGAQAAILIDADTGQILYAKNIDEKLMPASTTKIMTCLTALKRGASLDDIITVSQAAIDANDPEGSNMGLYAGEQLTLEEILTGILVCSANEGCNALAEHMAGSMDGYVDYMNEEAKNMGLSNTHFVTTNGLPDPDHYTTARDLSTIARDFFSYDILCRLSSTPSVEIEETSLHRAHSLYSKNKLYKNRDYEYPYLLGSKTGYTDDARQTLVSAAEKDGVRLICVILKEEAPYQFEDTVNLFDYGFANFSYSKISDFEKTFDTSYDYLSDSNYGSLISLDTDVKVLLPNNADLSNITSQIVYREDASTYFADINYYYNGYYIGKAGLTYNPITATIDEIKIAGINNKDVNIKIVNVKKTASIVVLSFVGVLVLIRLILLLKKLYLKHREKVKRSQKYNDSKKINRKADRQRRLGMKREIKLTRKRLRDRENSKKKKKKGVAKRYKKNRHQDY